MRKIKNTIILLVLIATTSCYDGLNDMLGDLDMKVPVCVNSSVAASGDGRGWGNAYKTIQEAINSPATQAGDEIWIAGTFTISTTADITRPVTLYGGFNGTENRLDERDLNNKTVINIITSPGLRISTNNVTFDGFQFINTSSISIRIDSSYSVVVKNCFFGHPTNTTPGPAINNAGSIQIEKCYFNKLNRIGSSGAAILSTAGSVSITETTFQSNNTTRYSGGSICTTGGSNLTISKSYFINNSTELNGGAIFSSGSSSGEILIYDTFFTGNMAAADGTNTYNASGGACYFDGLLKLTISHCTFGDIDDLTKINKATDYATGIANGGAIYISNTISAEISDSFFYKNTAADSGGAIYESGNTAISISNSTMTGNQAASGGGIYSASALTISGNSKILQNTASGDGGGIYFNASAKTLSISNSTITGITGSGSAANGGGIYINLGTCNLLNCTIDNNTASTSGGGIYITTNGVLTVDNSLFHNNTATANSGGAIMMENNGYGRLTAISCRFSGNKALNSANGRGGAVFLSTSSAIASSIVNSLFYNNQAGTNGGAIFLDANDSTKLVNLAFYNNSAVTNGGGIYTFNINNPSNPYTFYNLVFYTNNAPANSNNIYSYGNNLILNNCFFYDGVEATDGLDIIVNNCINNISASPFISIISSSSSFLYPADSIVDKGTDTVSGFTLPATDLQGNTRRMDIPGITNSSDGHIDMGCYERQ